MYRRLLLGLIDHIKKWSTSLPIEKQVEVLFILNKYTNAITIKNKLVKEAMVQDMWRKAFRCPKVSA